MKSAIITAAAAFLLGACAAGSQVRENTTQLQNQEQGSAKICEQMASSSVGQLESFVVSEAKKSGTTVRFIERDGIPSKGTHDYRPERLNIGVNQGKVSRAYCG